MTPLPTDADRQRVREARERQGLSPTLDDPAVADRIALLLLSTGFRPVNTNGGGR